MRNSVTPVCRQSLVLLIISLITFGSCKKKDVTPLSTLAGLTAFNITDVPATFTIDEGQKKISNADSLPFQTDVSKLVANFTSVPKSVVKVGNVVQVSGTTVNDFSQPLQYVVTAQDGKTAVTYTVLVNVAKIDPKTISWQQITPDAGWGNNHSTFGGSYNNNLYMFTATLGSFGAYSFGSYSSADGLAWTRIRSVDNNGDSIPHAESSSFISFNNKMWLIGGHIPGVGFAFDDVTSKVWSSTDGITWAASAPAAVTDRWSKRERAGVVVFNNKLWVIGGNPYPPFGNTNSPGPAYHDVWNSADGTAWTSVNANPAFTARTEPAIFVYDNKMWVAGGKDNSGNYLNDLWNSADGVTWTQVSSSNIFTPRSGHQVIVNNGKAFLLGGENASGVLGDLWASDDAVNWTSVASGDVRALPANFKGRKDFNMFVKDDAVYIMGGLGVKDANNRYTYTNDVWKGKFQ